MARVSVMAVEALLAKRVQEMVLSGDEPPPPYVCRDDEHVQNVPSASCELPIIDFGLLSSPTPPAKQKEELEKLKSALSFWGCFQVHTHIFHFRFVGITCTNQSYNLLMVYYFTLELSGNKSWNI